MVATERIKRLGERNKVARNQACPLMNQLIERVLTISTRFAPIDRPGRVVNGDPIECNVFAIALHGQLLQVSRKPLQILLVGNTATVSAPKKSLYQTARSPMSTGRLLPNGAVRKCSSISWNPASRARKLSGPAASIVDRPIAESIE